MRMKVTRPIIQSKIHRARVTGADLHYVGPVTIDKDLLDATNIVEGQRADIADIDNGERLSTHTTARPRGSGVVQLSGAAVHLVSVDDLVIIIVYCQVPESQIRGWRPAVAFADKHSHIIETGDSVGRVPGEPE